MCRSENLRRLWAILAFVVVLPLAACGDEDEDEAAGPSKLSIVEREEGSQLTLEVEGDATPGITRITFRNEGRKPHSAQLVEVTGNRSEDDFIAAYKRVSDRGPTPSWFRAGGGVGTTRPGKSASVTQDLRAGTYYVVDDADDGNAGAGGIAKLEVSGDFRRGGLPQRSKVIAEEYTFTASGLRAGSNTVLFNNSGKEPHHLVAAPIRPGSTIADVRRFVREDRPQGRPPADFDAGASTAVLEGGTALATKLELKRGRYALLCFVADRKGGPPHVAKGMVSAATVE